MRKIIVAQYYEDSLSYLIKPCEDCGVHMTYVRANAMRFYSKTDLDAVIDYIDGSDAVDHRIKQTRCVEDA
jgi:hypothetical protein